MSRTAAILLAAGSGKRMQGSVADKALAILGGRPVFDHSVAAFMQSGIADFFVVVYRDQRQMLELAASAPTPSVLVRGGRQRQDSVMNGLEALPGDVAYVFIHDCARPLVKPEQLVALHRLVKRTGAAVLAHRVVNTIKEVRKGRMRTLDRSMLWATETPQAFNRDLICRAYAKARERKRVLSDDAAAAELLGRRVALLENPHPNPKLTIPADLAYMEFLNARSAV